MFSASSHLGVLSLFFLQMMALFISIVSKLLTPSDEAELEDVSAYVGVEDFDQSDVHVDGLQPHPGEGGQQEVVQEDGDGET